MHDERDLRHHHMVTQYATDANLAARQRLWQSSRREPAGDGFNALLELADVQAGELVVEVGCGNGEYLSRIDAVGLDVSFGMLTAARPRARGPLVCGDAQALPFVTAAFDVVLAPHMLYCVPDRELGARELRRITKPGGRCLVLTNSDVCRQELRSLVEEAIGTGWRWRRPPEAAFSMENGADQMRAGFESVETVWNVDTVFHVVDADLVAGYVASVGDVYEDETGVRWADVVATCRERAAGFIDRDGAFLITYRSGVFVCR